MSQSLPGLKKRSQKGIRSATRNGKNFVSTASGQQQWEAYASNSRFLLTIKIARENWNGAATGGYKWDDSGRLVAATIVLGDRLDHGYPNPIYYPVQYSLAPFGSSYAIDGDILAATKLAHEFGHVNRMSVTNSELYRLQMQLIPAYNSILLRNGYNTNDPRLTALARQLKCQIVISNNKTLKEILSISATTPYFASK